MERLRHFDFEIEDKQRSLEANHAFFKLLVANFPKHAKHVENVNRLTGSSAITSNNINKIIFGTFMKQPLSWRNVSGRSDDDFRRF